MWSGKVTFHYFRNKSVTGAPYSIKSYSLSHSWTLWWRVQRLKQCHLQVTVELQLQWCRITDDEIAFCAQAAVTGKAWSPSVVHRVVGITSVNTETLGRRRREPTSAVKWRVSARYDGTVAIRQWYVRTHNQKWNLSWTFSQCSSWRSGVMCSDFLTENTRREAALKTDCSRCNSCPEIPERTELQ